MSYDENVRRLQRELRDAGYEVVRTPVDISALAKADKVIDCEIIARKDFFNIMYMEVESDWRGIAARIVLMSKHPCVLITRYGNTHHILSTVKEYGTRDAEAMHVVVETRHTIASLAEFIRAIKVNPHDDHILIDIKVQAAFDKFSEYKQALDEFGKNLAAIIKKTEAVMNQAITGNKRYDAKAKNLLGMCKEVISDQIDMDDIRSMLLQHILTYRIFALVYDVTDFHETNAVARSLEEIKNTLDMPHDKISYKTMELIAESVTDIDQRQEFLKKVYETFYEKYDPDRADKDGIVYTPSEAVSFMVKSTDELLKKHFNKSLSDDGVTILDPTTGTGTFLVYIIKQIKKTQIKNKYINDLHANEISILPYYIATLNIEHAYKEVTGEYKEFENICWMDTLDSGVKDYERLTSYFKGNDNVKRMSKQQNMHIHVTIGNPPYNAVQTSYNNANPADKYDHLDKKILKSYYEGSSATNNNTVFDMYKRFLKWSSDRINGNGMVVFISNNSFLDAKADDGIRRALYNEFDYIYVVNLKGNARLSGEAWRREGEKLFGEQARVGVCISFFIKTGERHSEIQYVEVADYTKREAKLEWLDKNTILKLKCRKILPDKDAIWLNQTDNDFESLCPVLPGKFNESIFKDYTLGVKTNKDDWVYDFDRESLALKMKYYTSTYNRLLKKYSKLDVMPTSLINWLDKKIKWSSKVENEFKRRRRLTYKPNKIVQTLYRPFVSKLQYYDRVVTERPRSMLQFFYNGQTNFLISFPNPKTNVKFNVVGTNIMTDEGCVNGTQNIPLWLYNTNNKKIDNVTEFALELFRKHYSDLRISAEDVFYYIYAIFNDPKYEKKYRYDLRRNLPQIPLAKDFSQWSSIGKKLFHLHCNFDSAKEFNIQRVDKNITKTTARLSFKKDKNNIRIIIDDSTTLENIPRDILEWKFDSRTPLEWILEFYKEAKNRIKAESCDDEKIRDRFSTYSIENHKEKLIMLLSRVTTVCIETVQLRRKLESMEWGVQPDLKLTPNSKASKRRSPRNYGQDRAGFSKAQKTIKHENKQGGTQTKFSTWEKTQAAKDVF